MYLRHSKTTTPEHTTKKTKEIIRGKKWKVLDWPSQSPDLSIKRAFNLLKETEGAHPPTKYYVLFTLVYFKHTSSHTFVHQMIISSKFCSISRCKYLELKVLVSYCHILMSNPNVFSVHKKKNKNKKKRNWPRCSNSFARDCMYYMYVCMNRYWLPQPV